MMDHNPPPVEMLTKDALAIPGGLNKPFRSLSIPDEIVAESRKIMEAKQERDPNGLPLNVAGAKADAGKNRVYLCLSEFSRALEKVSEVTTYGANKYTPNGWKEVLNGEARYFDAFGRHFLKNSRERIDRESGCDHLAQMIWNLLAAYELQLLKEENHIVRIKL